MNQPLRILFVFAWLGSGEDGEARLLSRHLPTDRYRIDIVACFRKPMISEPSYEAPRALDVPVDTTPYHLSFEETIIYLAGIVPAYDIIVSCQNVADIYPALESLIVRPPLIEHGRVVAHAEAGPKHLTARYVGTSATIRDAAAARMPGRDADAIYIPSMTAAPGEVIAAAWRALFDAVAAETRRPAHRPVLFESFLQGGFECSSHRRAIDRARRDIITLSSHDIEVASDYRLLNTLGIRTIRDGVRWHLIEAQPGMRDWSSLDPMLAAAANQGMEVIWDIMHYGWPDHIDIWSPDFPARFADFALAAAQRIAARTSAPHYFCAINEISFLSWAGGEVACMNPFARGRGTELKVQLVRALLAAQRAIRGALRQARFVVAEPIIHIVPHPERSEDTAEAHARRHAQFEVVDMIAGRAWPQLGGDRRELDIVGLNHYPGSIWIHREAPIPRGDPGWRPLREMLAEAYARTGRPLLLSETGCEGDERAEWFRYVTSEVSATMAKGIPVEGVCLYPAMGHVGWDDERYCPNGII